LAKSKKDKIKEEYKKLHDDSLKYLDSLTENEEMPYFVLNTAEQKKQPFADFFIAKHCRNAYAGLFIKLNASKDTGLNVEEVKWVSSFRKKGYACSVITTANQLEKCVQAYKHTIGVSGYNYFYATYERSHR